MPTLRKRSRILETSASPNHINQNNNGGIENTTSSETIISGYEQSREKRIKENLERMQKLGIFDLSLKLKTRSVSNKLTRKNSAVKKTPNRISPSPLPTRRSSRLSNATPVTYSELPITKKERSWEDDDGLLEEGLRPEIYTEKHEKLLGDCKMSWTLYVDGYRADGTRIYDPVKGKTCHQCRQKTLGHRTHCIQCNMVQGQFCGDCLYTRYGEHVLEANQNPDWICPVCRGICNCSLCRKTKGWLPTGYLYKKVSSLGFKSVAHYLIQTRRSEINSENNLGTKTPLSAKRSLPFTDTETPSTKVNDDHLGVSKHQSEGKRDVMLNIKENKEEMSSAIEPSLDSKDKGHPTPEMHPINDNSNKKEPKSAPKKKKPTIEPSPNSIGGRLRRRRKEEKGQDGMELIVLNEETLVAEKAVPITSYESEADVNMKLSVPTEFNQDSIGGRLRSRRKMKLECSNIILLPT